MTNVVKHAQAKECHVLIDVKSKSIMIYVRDDGRRISTSVKHKAGIWLTAIKSKIKLLNGKIVVHSNPGMGTKIEIILPRIDSTIKQQN